MIAQLPRWIQEKAATSKTVTRLVNYMTARGNRPDSIVGYASNVFTFASSLGSTPDELLAKGGNWSLMLNDYITDAHLKGLSSKYIARVVHASKKWLQVNGVPKSALEGVEAPRQSDRVTRDRAPTREELRRILGVASIEDKVLLTVAASSGLRLLPLLRIQLKDFRGLDPVPLGRRMVSMIEDNENGNSVRRKRDIEFFDYKQTRDIVAVEVSEELSKGRRPYVTFISNEAAAFIKVHLRERQERGEQLSPEAPLIVSLRGRHTIDRSSGDRRWKTLVKKAGLWERPKDRSQLKEQKWASLHFHVLRRFFRTSLARAGVDTETAEFFMGHSAGLSQTYFIGNAEQIADETLKELEDAYKLAESSLSLLNESEDVRELKGESDEMREKVKTLEAALKAKPDEKDRIDKLEELVQVLMKEREQLKGP